MSRRVLTTTALLGATLALSVPTAWGSGDFGDHGDAAQARLSATPRPLVIVRDHGDASEARLEPLQPLETVRDHGAATQAKLSPAPAATTRRPVEITRDHGDATQAKLVGASTSPLVIVRDHGDAMLAKITAQSSPASAPAETSNSSGSEIEWSQLGIGFAIGMLLVLGLILAVRFTRSRPLAH